MDLNGIYIGFDGGGSTSRFLIRRGEAEPELHTVALNLKYSDLGIEQSARAFANCLSTILGADISMIGAICISLSGASDVVMNKQFQEALQKELNLPQLKIYIESDSSFTLETAYPGDKSGMLLIAGTGSVAIAKKRNGEIVKVGGWGRLLGDEGSGYWIGLQALKHYCKVMDGAETAGELFVKIGEKLHDETDSYLSPLRYKLYRDEIKPQHFTPLVFASIESDPAAEGILYEAGEYLMNNVKSLWNKVQRDCEPILRLHGAIVRQPFISALIEDQCKSLNLRCSVLDEKEVINKALEVAKNLSPS